MFDYQGKHMQNAQKRQSVKQIQSKEKDERLTSPKNLGQLMTEEQPGPATSPPTKGGGQMSQPGCGRTPGGVA